MFRDEVATCAAHVGKLRIIAELCISDEAMRDRAVEMLDEIEHILIRPNGDTSEEQRAKWREQKRRQKEKKDRKQENIRGTSAELPQRTVVVEEVEEVEEEGEEEVAAEQAGPRVSYALRVSDIYEHYRTKHPRAAPRLASDTLEYRRIVAALKSGHEVSDCCEAIDGYHRSPFHCGVNDNGQKHLSLSLIFRDADHITKGIEMANDPLLGHALSEKTRRSISAGVQFIEEGQQ